MLAIAIETNISAASRTSCRVLRYISELAQSSRVAAWHEGEWAVGVNISANGACARKAVRGNRIRILSPWAGINTDRAREELSLWANIKAHFKATDTPSLILEGLIKIGCEGKTYLVEIVVERELDSVNQIICVLSAASTVWLSGVDTPGQDLVVDICSISLDDDMLVGPLISSQDREFHDYTLMRRNVSEVCVE